MTLGVRGMCVLYTHAYTYTSKALYKTTVITFIHLSNVVEDENNNPTPFAPFVSIRDTICLLDTWVSIGNSNAYVQ